jgi:hypothetical protein
MTRKEKKREREVCWGVFQSFKPFIFFVLEGKEYIQTS